MPDNEKANILIVDDKANNIFALEEILSRPDRHFIRATNGQEALKIVLNETIDLIILDVQMPDMDGFEVAKILKSHNRTKDIPIIFASAEKKEHRFMMKGFEEGAVDYLYKPLDPAVTSAKVSVLLQLHLQKKELVAKNLQLENAHGEIRQLNADLERNIALLQVANKELESFSYSVSHDLRTPLRSIDGYSRIILEDHQAVLNDELRRLLGNIRTSSTRMGILIDHLLEFSRLGRRKLVKRPVDLTEMAHRVVRDLEQGHDQDQDHDPDHQRTAVIRIGSLPPAEGDPVLLYQVLVNLVSNAIKYSGKIQAPEIEIGASENGEERIYFVKDNGVGFNMEYAHRLFGVFQRLHGNDEFEGTGVGLAIVQRIIEKHGGRVWAEGRPKEGATFFFSLPHPIIQ
ncbi:MAG TPA: ATP-binding protein [Puia sp.]|nr:ATP-binding protein [Puia sp.]